MTKLRKSQKRTLRVWKQARNVATKKKQKIPTKPRFKV